MAASASPGKRIAHFYYKRSKQLGLALGPQRVWKDKLVGALEASNAA